MNKSWRGKFLAFELRVEMNYTRSIVHILHSVVIVQF